MLSDAISRYVELHRALGFKFRLQAYLLRSFARFAESRGDGFVRNETVLDWAGEAPSAAQRRDRLRQVRRFAEAMQAEDRPHEVPTADVFGRPMRERRRPHIYTTDEIGRLLRAAAQLSPKAALRPATYVTLFALLVSTGIRISEALALRIEDITPAGLLIRHTKFRKSRLVPFHSTVGEGLDRYLVLRRQVGGDSTSLFVSKRGTGLPYSTVNHAFLDLARSIGLRGGPGTKGPRLHDFRHYAACRIMPTSLPA
jgi:integrase